MTQPELKALWPRQNIIGNRFSHTVQIDGNSQFMQQNDKQ